VVEAAITKGIIMRNLRKQGFSIVHSMSQGTTTVTDCRSVPEGRWSPPPYTGLHLLELFRDNRRVVICFVEFLARFEQVVLRMVMVMRMDELMDEFGGPLAYRAVGVDEDVGGLGDSYVWAAAPRGGMD
jgi:hypothetical protein